MIKTPAPSHRPGNDHRYIGAIVMTILTYQGKAFNQREVDGYVNLGQLCATHGKKLNDWNRLKSSKAYLEALSEDTGIPVSSLIVLQRGF